MGNQAVSDFACQACSGPTRVLDTRALSDRIRRRRECLKCLARVTTHERAVDEAHRNSDVTANLVTMLTDRDALGLAKYGKTLDRKDLTPQQWLQHLTEELLDGAGYAQAILRELNEGRT
jgi:hypothetical protein